MKELSGRAYKSLQGSYALYLLIANMLIGLQTVPYTGDGRPVYGGTPYGNLEDTERD